jgi:chaperonin GroES
VGMHLLNGNVAVQRDAPEGLTRGGIVIPGRSQEKPARGLVVSVYERYWTADDAEITPSVRIGDEVVFADHAGDGFNTGGGREGDILIMREDQIMGVVEA